MSFDIPYSILSDNSRNLARDKFPCSHSAPMLLTGGLQEYSQQIGGEFGMSVWEIN